MKLEALFPGPPAFTEQSTFGNQRSLTAVLLAIGDDCSSALLSDNRADVELT